MKNIITLMIFLSCLGMMYGKIFVKPEQYHYVQDRGYLNKKDYASFNRQFLAKDLAQSFDSQIDSWYSQAYEDIMLDDISRAMMKEYL